MTDQDPTAELRERMDATILAVTDLWPEPLDEVHDVPQVRNALIAAGFGDVAAERARARDYLRQYLKAVSELVTERERIDAAKNVLFNESSSDIYDDSAVQEALSILTALDVPQKGD